MGHPGEDSGDALNAYIAGLGMPRSLGAVNIRAEHFDRMAEQAMGMPWVPRNLGRSQARLRSAKSSN